MVIRTGKKLQKAVKERTSTLDDLRKKVETLWREREEDLAVEARQREAREEDLRQRTRGAEG